MSVEVAQPDASTSSSHLPTASTSGASLPVGPQPDPRFAHLPRAPPTNPDPTDPTSAVWVTSDGQLAIGREVPKPEIRAIELPLLSAKVGHRWFREGTVAGKGKLKAKVEEWSVLVGYKEVEEGSEFVEDLGLACGAMLGAELVISHFEDGREGSTAELRLKADWEGVVDDLVLSIDTQHTSGYNMYEVEAVKGRLERWRTAAKWSFQPTISDLYATPIPPEGMSIMPIPPRPVNYDPSNPATWTPKFKPITDAEVKAAWDARDREIKAQAAAAAAARAIDGDDDAGLSPPGKKRRPNKDRAFKPTISKTQLAADASADDDETVITAADFTVDRPRRSGAAKSYKPEYPSGAFSDEEEEQAEVDAKPAPQPKASTSKAAATASRAPQTALSPQPATAAQAGKKRRASGQGADGAGAPEADGQAKRKGGAQKGKKRAADGESAEAAPEGVEAELAREAVARHALEKRVTGLEAELRAVKATLAGQATAAVSKGNRRSSGQGEVAELQAVVRDLQARLAVVEGVPVASSVKVEDDVAEAGPLVEESEEDNEEDEPRTAEQLLAAYAEVQQRWSACADKDGFRARRLHRRVNALAERLNEVTKQSAKKGRR